MRRSPTFPRSPHVDQPENHQRKVPDDLETRGVFSEVVVSLAQPILCGAAGAYFANKLNRPKDPPADK